MPNLAGTLRNRLTRMVPPPARAITRAAIGIPLAKVGRWRVRCPICEWRFRSFLPWGDPPQPNVQCPRCGSVGRHRLLYLFLRDRTDLLTRRLRLLHLAPEPALAAVFSGRPSLSYVRSDLQISGVSVSADITRLPFRSGGFDVVLCSHVLEHVTDDRAAMQEIHRILAAGGRALILVPADLTRALTYEDPRIVDPVDRRFHFGQGDHVRLYGRDIVDKLRGVGFEVSTHHYARELAGEQLIRFGLTDEPIYECFKPGG